ncbi:ferrous iron transport protein A [Hymenobacter busanensis]|uniref:Ferrous iron transport protein A n=1 Tax=Hymenobacter busanensis TaxID=2607656 RepID=A0A7L4ZZH1_9BACT|nr:FeoA family protein [Hymenobacter busanensis]KAA9331517.1 ferrous iron transport protein A [Hymenobacter busanensis]QHJ08671.1 ferrous iron transport protein A [Hymenobacter busanensis]
MPTASTTSASAQRSVKDLRLGETGTICCLKDPEMALKLLEMGCIPGTRVTLNGRAPLGCPITLHVDGEYTLSLRVSEAATILLKE